MISQEVVKKTMSDDYQSNGRHCRFYEINNKIALKVYDSINIRDKTYNNQKVLAKLGFAPEVYEKIDIDNANFCYVTEVVDLIGNDDKINTIEAREICDKINFMNCNDLWIYKNGYNEGKNVPFNDNWGYKNDKLVIIDCEG